MICQVDMLIHDANSLKEKRSVIKSVIQRTMKKYYISIIESDFQDFWQKSQLSFSFCSLESSDAEKKLNKVLQYIESNPYIEIYNVYKEGIHL